MATIAIQEFQSMIAIDYQQTRIVYPVETLPCWGDLARAAVARACLDAANSRADPINRALAAAWLVGPDGEIFAELASMDHEAIKRWVNSGCPDRRGKRKRLSTGDNGRIIAKG